MGHVMSSKWDKKYQQAVEAGSAADVLEQNQHLLPTKGIALDLACGLGANALFLAKKGLEVWAWDSSAIAIDKLNQFAQQQALSLKAEQRDVLAQPPLPGSVDVLVVSLFLDRTFIATLLEALKPGGLVFYQTYCEQKVSQIGPSNPAYLLKENELLNFFSAFKVRVYREESLLGDHEKGWRNQAMIVAEKP